MEPKAVQEEEDEGFGWGKSLPVPSVQEMVRIDSQSVPDRYIHETDNSPLESQVSDHESAVPVINFSLLANGDYDEQRKLDLACKEWGFFQDHGITEKVLEDTLKAQAAFFEFQLEEKKKYAMAANDLQGYGQGFVVSEHQKLEWCDLIFLLALPAHKRRFKFWPLSIPGFREAVENYSTELHRVTEELLANLSVLMGMEKEGLKSLHKEMKQLLRMNYYPPCSKPELVLGVSPHSDGSTITLLLQDDDITGLQIRHENKWVPVKPIPNAIVVNIGDAMECWSNGVYKSIEHKAITNDKRARMSIAAFVLPEDDVMIGPLETMVNAEHQPKMYRDVKYIDYTRHMLGRKLESKTHTDFLKLQA